MNLFTKIVTPPFILSLMGICLISGSVMAADYYRWVGEDGITHYGSMPPAGVESEKMKSSGGATSGVKASAPVTDTSKPAEPSSAPEISKELLAERQAQCAQEKERLKTLTSKGSKIRMQDEKGNTRYLNNEELAKEVSTSEKFIREACK